MEYAEFLRLRRSLSWYLGILAAFTLVSLALGHPTSIVLEGDHGSSHLQPGSLIPLGPVVEVAAFLAMIFASIAGGSLNREFESIDISWTKPLGRTALAVRYVLLDVAAVVLVFVITLLFIIGILVRLGAHPVAGAMLVPELMLGAGAAVMWYALIELLTFWFPGRAQMARGVLWPVALIAIGLHDLTGVWGVLVHAINVVNPLAYTSISDSDLGDAGPAFWQGATELRALAVWLLAALFCTIAVTLWPRREA